MILVDFYFDITFGFSPSFGTLIEHGDFNFFIIFCHFHFNLFYVAQS